MAASIDRVANALQTQGYTVLSINLRPDRTSVTSLVWPNATSLATQIAALTYLSNTFDWSDQAEQTWKDAQLPAKAVLRDAATDAIAQIDSYLVIADTANATQVRSAVKQLATNQRKIIQRLVQLSETQ